LQIVLLEIAARHSRPALPTTSTFLVIFASQTKRVTEEMFIEAGQADAAQGGSVRLDKFASGR
jgi:hypothetical protein